MPTLPCDGKLLATSDANGIIRIWDVRRLTTVLTIPAHVGPATALAFAPDWWSAGIRRPDHAVKLWEVASGNSLAVMAGHLSEVADVALAPDGRTIASAGGFYHGADAAEVKLWDTFTGQQTQARQGSYELGHGRRILQRGPPARNRKRRPYNLLSAHLGWISLNLTIRSVG